MQETSDLPSSGRFADSGGNDFETSVQVDRACFDRVTFTMRNGFGFARQQGLVHVTPAEGDETVYGEALTGANADAHAGLEVSHVDRFIFTRSDDGCHVWNLLQQFHHGFITGFVRLHFKPSSH